MHTFCYINYINTPITHALHKLQLTLLLSVGLQRRRYDYNNLTGINIISPIYPKNIDYPK